MGLFDWFSEDSDLDVGTRLLEAYFDEASQFPEFQYSDYDSWMTWMKSRVPDFDSFVGSLVKMNSASTSVGQAENRLVDLANQSKGLAKPQDIVKAAGGGGDTINWWAAIPDVGYNTVADAADLAVTTAQDIGTGVTGTLKLTKYLPYILVGGGALFIYAYAKSMGGGMGSLLGRSKSNPKRRRRR